MLPKPPPRLGQLGFLYFPPLRVQGTSVAGEATAVMVPEYDVCFDIGACLRPMLSSKYVAITHGHMDHVAGLPYYFSQRWFQGMGTGACVCDKRLAPAVSSMMQGWVSLERQETSHEIIALGDEEEYEIKRNTFLRAFHVDHTVPSVGYCLIERRTKLKAEFHNLPQDELMRIRKSGTPITYEIRVPIVSYIGDTLPGPHLLREDFCQSRIVIMECTFFEKSHKERAAVGKHVHIDDLVELLPRLKAEAIVLTHISRRTNLHRARQELIERVGLEDSQRFHLLMDHRENKKRYESQLAEVPEQEPVVDSTNNNL